MNMLISKKCIPCTGTVPPLQDTEIKELLKQISDKWSINDKGHLYREFRVRNFKDAMDYANQIAILAEQENHHPDLYIAWGKCSVEIWTHKISGLTESDFILSAKIDGLFYSSHH